MRFQPIKDAPPLLFEIPVVSPQLVVPKMLPDAGPLMKLWRDDQVARERHLVNVDYHVGFDMDSGAIATMVQPTLVANPRELPA